MNIEPLYDRIILEEIESPASAPSSPLIMTGKRDDEPLLAKVIAVPLPQNRSEKDDIFVKSGDTVVFSKFAGTAVKLQGKNYIIIRQTDILAIINGEKK